MGHRAVRCWRYSSSLHSPVINFFKPTGKPPHGERPALESRRRLCVFAVVVLCLLAAAASAQDAPQSGAVGQRQNPPSAAKPTPTPVTPPGQQADPTNAPPSAPLTSDSSTTSATVGAAKTVASVGGHHTVNVPPEKANPVRLARFDNPPVIDGKLDDEMWKHAAAFKDFYQVEPGDNIAPTKPTEAFIGYDAHNLYVAFHAYDDPSQVRARVAKRDGISDDDNVGMYLDTFHDHRRAYQLEFNPLGIQADAIRTEGGDEDYSFDIVMESKGQMTADGYTVEVAIPFKSLRYETGKGKLWGLHLFRIIKHANNETDSWMPISRDIEGTLIQEGAITGIEGISTARTLEIIPSLTVSETGRRVHAQPPTPFPSLTAAPDTGRFVNEPIQQDIGVTTKFTLTPTITLDFAYNPDFAQVEADQTVITANQRFPIFFPEKRPFFLEGKEIFETRSTVVHTRAIIDPDYAVKLTGKRGKNTFGLILASDNAPGNFSEDELDARRRAFLSEPDPDRERIEAAQFQTFVERFVGKNAYIGVARVKHDVGSESSVGAFATAYSFIERHNEVGGVDGRFKLDPKTIATFELIGTTSRAFFREPDLDPNLKYPADHPTAPGDPVYPGQQVYRTGNGFAYNWVLDYTGRHFGYVLQGNGRTHDYRADVGFTQQTNTNESFGAIRLSTEPNPKAMLTKFTLQNFVVVTYNWQASLQSWSDGTNYNFNFAHQTFVQVGTNFGYERIFEEEFGARRGPARPTGALLEGAFAGNDNERQTRQKTIFVYGERQFTKQFYASAFVGTRRGVFDFDFGAGPKFPRVSPTAINSGQGAPLDPGSANSFDVNASVNYKPTNALNLSLDYTKARLTRRDNGLVAFDDNIYVARGTYQFTRYTFVRARIDYDSLAADARGQFLLGWTPNPGTAFYVGYNDDLNRNGFNPFTGQLEPGFRRNGRTFFVKLSYLFRKSFE
ncbi:MAG: carbohydrate binding family 9 domain-containing protein [Pyrinomonadaceae bacterium]